MSSFDIYLDNVSCVREKLYPVRRPDIVTPKRNYKEYDIPGRDGKYFEDLGTYDDITFNINFNFKERREYLNKTFRDYKRMIRKSKTLMMMDDSEIFYKIKKVEFGDISRESTKEINAFVATFTCDPYGYLFIGQDRYSCGMVQTNPYAVSHPVYIISGEGQCVLSVNGNKMTVNTSGTIYIDTDRCVAYRENGDLQNVKVSGDFESLYLMEGSNSITVSGNFKCEVIPNWRCEL